MFKTLGRFTAAHAWTICAAWLAAAIVLALVAPSWDTRAQDDDVRFLPARCDSVRGYQLLRQAFPQDVFASRLIFAVERPDRRLDADDRCALVQVALQTPYLALQTRKSVDRAEAVVRRRMAEAGPGAPLLLTTGPAGVGRDLTRASADSLQATTLATVLLVLVVLLLVYRAPLLALVPLVTIALATWVALSILALLTLIPGVYLVNVSKVFAIVLLYGAGTDYCLFLISRYREELARGHQLTPAIGRSVVGV